MTSTPERLAYMREYNAKRRKDPKYREQEAIRQRRSYERYRDTPKYKAAHAEAQRQYRMDAELRESHIARWKTHRALKRGRLVKQPCEVCNAPDVEAHHDDYSQPLAVRWLCKEHHRAHHAAAEAAGITAED